jgi:hypothetical protein
MVNTSFIRVIRVLLTDTKEEISSQITNKRSGVTQGYCLCSVEFEKCDHHWDDQTASIDTSEVSEEEKSS